MGVKPRKPKRKPPASNKKAAEVKEAVEQQRGRSPPEPVSQELNEKLLLASLISRRR